MKIKDQFILLVIFMIIILLTGCVFTSKKSNFDTIKSVGGILEYKDIDFKKVDVVEDTYELLFKEKSNDYLFNSLVEVNGGVKVSDPTILININAYFDLVDMFEDLKLDDIIVRRGYLDEEGSKKAGVKDHYTGYDLDVYVKGHEWTNFLGVGNADKLVENSYKYGFILRYNTDKKSEPWHYRYIGKIHSNLMHAENKTIDEYLACLDNLKVNTLYKYEDNYIYKVKKKDVYIPYTYKYSVSSIDDDYYIISFNTNKSTSIEETSGKTKSYKLNNVSYDLALVNSEHVVKHESDKLVSITNYLQKYVNDSTYLFDETALKNLSLLISEAKKLDRHTTFVTSAYRSKEYQSEIYDKTESGYASKPGYSEHQTGLGIDLANSYKDNKMFNKTVQGRYIYDNGYKYGFILRYPNEASNITNINYEEWHYRYVGKLHATIIKEYNFVLEEYIDYFKLNKFYQVKIDDQKYTFYKTEENDGFINLISDKDEVYYLYDNLYLAINK